MSKINYNIRISEKHEDQLTEYSEKTGIAKTDIMREALEEFFERKGIKRIQGVWGEFANDDQVNLKEE